MLRSEKTIKLSRLVIIKITTRTIYTYLLACQNLIGVFSRVVLCCGEIETSNNFSYMTPLFKVFRERQDNLETVYFDFNHGRNFGDLELLNRRWQSRHDEWEDERLFMGNKQ